MDNSCIVLADKHQNILESLRGLLETSFGGVVMVADQPSLIEALKKIQPQVAIVDMSLLGHGDFNTACQLTKQFPEVKIIILSDYDEPGIVDEVMSAGALGFVLKRSAGEDLLAAIDSINENRIFVSPAVKRNK